MPKKIKCQKETVMKTETCLSTNYVLLTSVITEGMYPFMETNNMLPIE